MRLAGTEPLWPLTMHTESMWLKLCDQCLCMLYGTGGWIPRGIWWCGQVSIIRCELCGWPMAFLETWLHMLASRIRHELYGWPMAFLRKLATCARKLNWVWDMWLANGIPREIGCMCWPVELGMSYMAGQRHSWGIWYLCLQMGMSYVAG